MARSHGRGGFAIVELLRLGITLLVTAAGFALGGTVDASLSLGEPERTRLVTSVLGALAGYLLGGLTGRAFVRGVADVEARLDHVGAVELIAATLGTTLGALLGVVLLAPLVLLPYRQVTVPVAVLVVAALAYAGGRLGASRGGELSRFVGVRGRLEVRTPSRGVGTRIVDSSALMDGRLVDVARAGFLDGTLVVPTFVLDEVQGMADVEDPRRRRLARRGLDALKQLQDEGTVAVEVSRDHVASFDAVDAQLVALCQQRHASLVTVDSNLARSAEIAGVRVLNLHQLAEALRPPVIPGDQLRLHILRPGRDAGQGVGYLDDGTMVVVERASSHVGDWIEVDVTSIVQSRQGRLLFGVPGRPAATRGESAGR